jgi:sugar transferase (PEP-CTERM/EpsH1 system associated)
LQLQHYLTDKVKIPKSKIQRICNGVDIESFYPHELKTLLLDCPFELDENKVYIGTVGRMHGVKDQMTLVRAFISLMHSHQELKEDVFLFLIGEGPLKQEPADLLKENDLLQYVWLAGERKDIAEIMSVLDIFVLPSQAEGISNTILEAMASGLPVIATAVGGNPELVDDGVSGILVPVSSPESMKKALLTLIVDKEKRAKQGRQSRQRVLDNFSISAMVNKYTKVYESLLVKREE